MSRFITVHAKSNYTDDYEDWVINTSRIEYVLPSTKTIYFIGSSRLKVLGLEFGKFLEELKKEEKSTPVKEGEK